MITIPICRHRSTAEIRPGWWGCASPKLIVWDGVPSELCATQCPFVDHELQPNENPRPLPSPDCLELGPALRVDELLARGIDPAKCGCGGKVRRCGVHDLCTTIVHRDGMACCHGCPDYSSPAITVENPRREEIGRTHQMGVDVPQTDDHARSHVSESNQAIRSKSPADVTVETPVATMAEVLKYGTPGPWPDGWAGWENVRDAHIQLLEEEIRRPRTPPKWPVSRAIVSCVSAKPGFSSGKDMANGYFPGAWVLVKELRRLGCTLPIYFAHLGPLELDPMLARLFKPLGVTTIDLLECNRTDPMRILAGWETKVYAIEHAPAEEVLFLDSDNVPARDPTFLFDDWRYRETGAVFWPDLPPYDRNEWLPKVVWNNCGMEYRDQVDFESGQLLIHKTKAYRALRAARHLNEHSDWYYKFVYGDKSTFHLAWAKCDAPFAMPPTPAGWLHRSIIQHDLDGRVLFHHACQDKPTRDGYSYRNHLPDEGACDAHLAELRRAWNGLLWVNVEPTPSEASVMARLTGQIFRYRRYLPTGIHERPLRLLEDNRVGRGAAKCEFHWGVAEYNGRMMLAVTSLEGVPTFLARECDDGAWRGAWLEFEKCEVELLPA